MFMQAREMRCTASHPRPRCLLLELLEAVSDHILQAVCASLHTFEQVEQGIVAEPEARQQRVGFALQLHRPRNLDLAKVTSLRAVTAAKLCECVAMHAAWHRKQAQVPVHTAPDTPVCASKHRHVCPCHCHSPP